MQTSLTRPRFPFRVKAHPTPRLHARSRAVRQKSMVKQTKDNSLDEIMFFRVNGKHKKLAEREAKRRGFETASAWFRSLLLKNLARAA